MSLRTKRIVHILGIASAAIVFEVFYVLCLLFFRESRFFLLAVIGGSLLNVVLLIADIVFFLLGKELVPKTCILVYSFLILAAVVFYIMLSTGFMEIVSDKESLQAYLERAGGWMTGLFILLQFLQVIILPIPSTVTVVVGSALFGPFRGSIYSLVGIVLGSVVAFFIGRYAGYRVVAWLVGKETLDKWQKKIKGKDKLLLSTMFLLPVFPDDVLCFIAGLSSMSLGLFLVVILLSRVAAIFTTSYSVSLIPFNTWWGILIWILIGAAVIAAVAFLYKRVDAIQDWILKKFHRETRVTQKPRKGEFSIEIVDPDGSIVTKGVERETTDKK